MKFEHFETEVMKVVTKEDFNDNKHLLKQVDFESIDSFIMLLLMGTGISNALIALNKIHIISTVTTNTEEDIIKLIPEFRNIINLIDSR